MYCAWDLFVVGRSRSDSLNCWRSNSLVWSSVLIFNGELMVFGRWWIMDKLVLLLWFVDSMLYWSC